MALGTSNLLKLRAVEDAQRQIFWRRTRSAQQQCNLDEGDAAHKAETLRFAGIKRHQDVGIGLPALPALE